MKWNNRGHEFDEIGASFQKNSDLYIWGTDSVAADLVTRLKALKLPVRIVDESGTWCILGLCGLDVISPAQVLNVPEGKTVLVSAYGQGFRHPEDMAIHRGQYPESGWMTVLSKAQDNKEMAVNQ